EKYDAVKKRALHAKEIVPVIRKALQARTAMEWEEIFGVSVPCSAVRHVEDMFDDPQVLEQGFIVEQRHPVAGGYKGVARLIKFSDGQHGTPPCTAPLLGQHSKEILRALQYSDEQIQEALNSGAVIDASLERLEPNKQSERRSQEA